MEVQGNNMKKHTCYKEVDKDEFLEFISNHQLEELRGFRIMNNNGDKLLPFCSVFRSCDNKTYADEARLFVNSSDITKQRYFIHNCNIKHKRYNYVKMNDITFKIERMVF